MSISLQKALPSLADELSRLLVEAGHSGLAKQVPQLEIVERCRCGDDFCATFFTQPKPEGAYGAGHQNVVLDPEQGMLILDVVRSSIACVEVLYRDEIRRDLSCRYAVTALRVVWNFPSYRRSSLAGPRKRQNPDGQDHDS